MYGLCTIVFLVSAGYTNAATALFPVEEKPAEFADQEGCYVKHLNKVIPYGDYYPKKSCSKYSCYKSNFTQVLTCGVQHVDKSGPCHLVNGDLEQNYPNCCPWVMCSTIPPDALTSEDTPVTESTTQAADTKARGSKPYEKGPLTSEDTPVTGQTTQAADTKARGSKPYEKGLLTSEDTPVTGQTTQAADTKARGNKPYENGPLTSTSQDTPVTESTTQALETEAPIGTFDQEGSLAELLVAQASVNE